MGMQPWPWKVTDSFTMYKLSLLSVFRVILKDKMIHRILGLLYYWYIDNTRISDNSCSNPIKQTTKAHLEHLSINSSVLSDITLQHLLFLHQFAEPFLPPFSLGVLPTGDVWRRGAITMLKGMKLRLLEISLEPGKGKEEVAEFRLKNQATHFLVRCCLCHCVFSIKQ